MTRVALVAPLPPLRGGIAHHSDSLARAFLAEGHELRALSYRRQYPRLLFPGRSERDERQPTSTLSVRHELTSLNPLRWLHGTRALLRYRPDVVVVAWWNAALLGPVTSVLAGARLVGARTVLLAHNVTSHDGGRGVADEVAWRVLARAADAVVVHGEEAAAGLQRRHPRLSVVAHPLPLFHRFLSGLAPQPAARARVGLAPDAEVCLALGNVRPYKGVDVAVRALSRLAHRRPKLELIVAGEVYDNARASLESALSSAPAGRVRVLDRYLSDDEVSLHVSAADVLLASHRHASQSGVVQIAKAAGLPVIASRVGGLPELVDERAGDALVPPGDPDALAQAIDALFASRPWRGAAPSEESAQAGWVSLARALLASVGVS